MHILVVPLRTPKSKYLHFRLVLFLLQGSVLKVVFRLAERLTRWQYVTHLVYRILLPTRPAG